MSVLMGREGRVVLPKILRDKFKIKQGDRFIVREHGDQIVLIPLARYERPTRALHGSVQPDTPIDEPKVFARGFLRKQARKEFAT